MHRSLLLVFVLLSASLAGCMSDEPLVLEVTASETDVVVVESYQNGVLVENTGATVTFDFSRTASAVTYTLGVSDGREAVEGLAEEGSLLNLTFEAHGVYNVTATAIDARGKQTSQDIAVRVNLRIEWEEEGTQDPTALAFDPLPQHGGAMADYVTVESIVSNPDLIENLGGGREVDVTWRIVTRLEAHASNTQTSCMRANPRLGIRFTSTPTRPTSWTLRTTTARMKSTFVIPCSSSMKHRLDRITP